MTKPVTHARSVHDEEKKRAVCKGCGQYKICKLVDTRHGKALVCTKCRKEYTV